MKSKTSFFNKTVFMKNFTRFWPIWTLYLVIWIFIMPIITMSELSYSVYDPARPTYAILSVATYGGIIMSAIFCAAAAALVFMFTYSARSTNFMASLPVKRESMFITTYLSGLCWFIASNVIVWLLSLLASAGHSVNAWNGLCQWLLIVSLHNFIFYSIAVICAVIAGNIVGMGLLYAAANAGIIICEGFIRLIAAAFVKGLTFDLDFFYTKYVTPCYQLWGHVDTVYQRVPAGAFEEHHMVRAFITPDGWLSIGIYAAVALVLTVLALIIYKRRHMETASDLISVKPLRPVFKYLATFICALTIGVVVYLIIFMVEFDSRHSSASAMALCMILGAFVGYFGSEMLLNKSFRVFRKWKGFVICALLIAAAMACLRLDAFGIGKYIPNSDKVEEVYLSVSYSEAANTFTEKKDIEAVEEIHKLLLSDQYTANVTDAMNDHAWDVSTGNIFIRYYTGDRTIERQYFTTVTDSNNELCQKLDALLNTPEAILERYTPDMKVTDRTEISANIYFTVPEHERNEENADYVDYGERNIYLSGEQARYLYESCVLPDLKDGNLGRVSVLGEDGYHYAYDLRVDISFQNMNNTGTYNEYGAWDSGYEWDDIHFTVPTEAKRTMAYIEELQKSGEFDQYGNWIAEDEAVG